MLVERAAWVRTRNESAADSRRDAVEELWTRQRLTMPARRRTTLMAPNPLESLCSLVRHRARNSTRTRGSMMLPRWMGTVVQSGEPPFTRVTSFTGIAPVIATIEAEQAKQPLVQTKPAA